MYRKLLLIGISLLAVIQLYGQGFPCDGSIYYVATNTVVGSKFYKLSLNEQTGAFKSVELPLDNPQGRHITCLGYNVRDRHIYGLDFNTYELLRINTDGSITNFGYPEGLDSSYVFYAGGLTADGRRFLLVGRSKTTGLDERMYSINVNDLSRVRAGFFPLNADGPVSMIDLAVDPIRGTTFSFDEVARAVVVTESTGETYTNLSFKKVSQVFGALFFDRQGNLYGLGNASGGGGEQSIIYAINKSSGATERVTQVVGGRDTDACGCPFTLELKQSVEPRETDGCSEVTIYYEAYNQGGIGQVGVLLQDQLPEEFTITEVITNIEDVFVEVISGPGSNYLEVENWNLLLGKNRIEVKARINAPRAAIMSMQSRLGNLYAAYNNELFSDDPTTPEVGDSSTVKILDGASFQLEDYIRYSCDLDTVFLSMPLSGSYQWSTGSTDPVLAVTDNGTYRLTLTTDCFTIVDDIEVEKRTTPFFVDLGEDRSVKLGETVSLSFQTNLEEVAKIEWVRSNSTPISCNDCPQPVLTALEGTTVEVTLSDPYGCTFTDAVDIEVSKTKRIYFPTAFSPNGDDINDQFLISGDIGEILQLQIFDRWGSLVYEQTGGAVNSEEGWDGTNNGTLLPGGVYLYSLTIRFPDGEEEAYQGAVSILR